jgi:hypothetical protein
MSEGAVPVPVTTTAAPCAAGPGLERPRATTSIDGRSVASAIGALRAYPADDSRRRIAHAQRVVELLRRERAARRAPAQAR